MMCGFLFLLACSTFLTLSAQDVLPNKNILILGGNGFLGGETTVKLVENGHSVTILNRGNVYFDSDTRIEPIVSRILTCDREVSLSLECKELKNDSMYYDVVIDFTSYSPKQILDVFQLLRKKVGLYIYISSTAVYQVSSTWNSSKHRKEEDAVRPTSPQLRQKLQKEEPYGDGKLACEELLEDQERKGGFPFINLRLPVAVGPRDTTFRWWIYQLWILTHKVIHYPVHIPHGIRSELFSLVYVTDVADFIIKIVAMDKVKINSIKNKSFNLAFKEHIALPRIIKDIANYYGIDQVQHNGDDNSTWYFYPPAARAVVVDISRAQKLLEWEPVSWKKAMKSTSEFYHAAMTKRAFSFEKEMVLAAMLEDIVPDEYYDDFLMNLKQHFGQSVFHDIELRGGVPDGAAEIESHSDGNSDSKGNSNKNDEL